MALFSSSSKQSEKSDRGEEASLDQIRTRSRRRLLGAAVLLAVGVIGFPLMFETRPRPVDAKTPIVIPRKDVPSPDAEATKIVDKGPNPVASGVVAAAGAAAATVGAVASAEGAKVDGAKGDTPKIEPQRVDVSKVEPGAIVMPRTDASKPAAAAQGARAATQGATPVVKPEPKPVTVAAAAPAPAAAKPAASPSQARATAPVTATVTAPVTAPASTAATASTRAATVKTGFAIQVGAYAEEAGVRAARKRLDEAGLKSYTEPVKASDGLRTRVRLGPFKTREEAQRVADKVRATGLPSVVVSLG
jgi:DedD protein